jgi:hypothetical protein
MPVSSIDTLVSVACLLAVAAFVILLLKIVRVIRWSWTTSIFAVVALVAIAWGALAIAVQMSASV